MKNLKLSAAMSVLLGVMLGVPGAQGQSTRPSTNSAPGSQSSGTVADGGTASSLGGTSTEKQSFSARRGSEPQETLGGKSQDVIKACTAAVAELEASLRLIDLLERENSLLKERLDTETRSTAMLTDLNASRQAESDALKMALAAKSETLAAKDEVIASQQKLIDSLKAKKSSPWKRISDILIGVAAGALLR